MARELRAEVDAFFSSSYRLVQEWVNISVLRREASWLDP